MVLRTTGSRGTAAAECVCVPGRFTGRVCGERGRPLTFSLLC
jgi:hypothetical protein